MRLPERVAVITGAGGIGIGQAIAVTMAEEGARVVVNDIDGAAAEKVARGIRDAGGKAAAIQADVTVSSQVNDMVSRALEHFGRIDILVNNVGRTRLRPFHQCTDEDFEFVLNMNMKSTFYCTRAVLGHMIERRSGRIISNASINGIIGSPLSVGYSAAKAGIIGFTRSLAKEVGQYGITVNCVSPGAILTPGAVALGPEQMEMMAKNKYLPTFGGPKDIARAVIFLASEEGGYITGQNIPVCGGRSLGW
ncbi:MAG: SDR family oxidoreductase [Chloroflexi bacterium]|nr:SDR family oxidoreductase [Chloroflexota bacterium]